MRNPERVLLAWGLLALAGCKTPVPSTAEAKGSGPQSCHFAQTFRSFRPGDTLPISFSVRRDAQWCFDGLSISGVSVDALRVDRKPEHGTVRLPQVPGAVVVGYRPMPGYVGDDSFVVLFPVQGETVTMRMSVTVTP